jgi:hypothetical protein
MQNHWEKDKFLKRMNSSGSLSSIGRPVGRWGGLVTGITETNLISRKPLSKHGFGMNILMQIRPLRGILNKTL